MKLIDFSTIDWLMLEQTMIEETRRAWHLMSIKVSKAERARLPRLRTERQTSDFRLDYGAFTPLLAPFRLCRDAWGKEGTFEAPQANFFWWRHNCGNFYVYNYQVGTATNWSQQLVAPELEESTIVSCSSDYQSTLLTTKRQWPYSLLCTCMYDISSCGKDFIASVGQGLPNPRSSNSTPLYKQVNTLNWNSMHSW